MLLGQIPVVWMETVGGATVTPAERGHVTSQKGVRHVTTWTGDRVPPSPEDSCCGIERVSDRAEPSRLTE